MTFTRSIIAALALVGVVYGQAATSGFVTRTDYNGITCSEAYLTATYVIDTCAAPASLVVSYDTGSMAVTTTYYTNCSDSRVAMPNPETIPVATCSPYTQGNTSHQYSYSATQPAFTADAATVIYYDPTAASCSGNPVSVTQNLPVCFYNPYNGTNYQVQSCIGSTLTTTSCSDSQCTVGCYSLSSTVSQASGCTDIYNHLYKTCNPSASSSSGAATTGSAASGSTTAVSSGTASLSSTSGSSGSPTSTPTPSATTNTGGIVTTGATTGLSPTSAPTLAPTLAPATTRSSSASFVAASAVIVLVAAAMSL